MRRQAALDDALTLDYMSHLRDERWHSSPDAPDDDPTRDDEPCPMPQLAVPAGIATRFGYGVRPDPRAAATTRASRGSRGSASQPRRTSDGGGGWGGASSRGGSDGGDGGDDDTTPRGAGASWSGGGGGGGAAQRRGSLADALREMPVFSHEHAEVC